MTILTVITKEYLEAEQAPCESHLSTAICRLAIVVISNEEKKLSVVFCFYQLEYKISHCSFTVAQDQVRDDTIKVVIS